MSIIARSSILVTRFDSVPCDTVGVKWKYWKMLSSFLLILIVRTFVFRWWLILPRLFYPKSYNGVSKVCPIYYWSKYIEAFHQLDFSNINVSSLSHLLPWSSILICFFFFFCFDCVVWLVGSYSLTRDRIQAPTSGSAASYLLACQRIPLIMYF